jgi:hypothetical protein
VAAVNDPSWFYSSLAQSAASFVGLAGAFWILRVQNHVAEWNAEIRRLDVLKLRLDRVNKGQDHRPRPETEQRDVGNIRMDVRDCVDRLDTSIVPRSELWLMVNVVAALLLTSTVLPLLLLGSPTNPLQVMTLFPFVVLALFVGWFAYKRAVAGIRELGESRERSCSPC